MNKTLITLLAASLALAGCGRNNQAQQNYPNQGGQPNPNYQQYPNDPNYQQNGYQQNGYQQNGYPQNGYPQPYPQQNNTGNVVAGVAAGAAAGALATHAYNKYKNNQARTQPPMPQPTTNSGYTRSNPNVATARASNQRLNQTRYTNQKFTPTNQRPSYVRKRR